MRRRVLASAAVVVTTLVALTGCFADLDSLEPVGGGPSGGAATAPRSRRSPGRPAPAAVPHPTTSPRRHAAEPGQLQRSDDLHLRRRPPDDRRPSIYARPDGTDPYPAGTEVVATAYVLTNNSQQRLDLTDLSADYSSYGNDLATQDAFAGRDLLTGLGYETELDAQFPADAATWYLLPGESVVFANAWFHRDADGPLTLQFLWPAERIFLGANIQF